MYAAAVPDDPDKRTVVFPQLLQSKTNRFDGIRRIDRMAALFVGFHQSDEHVEAVPPGRSFLGAPELFNLDQRRLMVFLGSNRLDLHGRL